MRWLVPVAMACCVMQAEAAITVEQLQQQQAVTQGALLQYNLAKDEQRSLIERAESQWTLWQLYSQLAVLYYAGGDYDRGGYYQVVAVTAQTEYDRLMGLLRPMEAAVEARWRTYLRELARLQAMLGAYHNQ